MRIEYTLSQMEPKERKKVRRILERAKRVDEAMVCYDKFAKIGDAISLGWRSDKIRAIKVIYLVTYIGAVMFSDDPFHGFFFRLFASLFAAVPYTIVTTFSTLVLYVIYLVIRMILRPIENRWNRTRHIFTNYIERATREKRYAQASGDFFDREEEEQAMEEYREINPNYRAPAIGAWARDV